MSAEFHPTSHTQAPPTHIQTTTSYEADQQEPLLSLLTSTHPLAASLINGSLSAYKTTQSYIPGAQWTERNVGLPLAGKISRVTGVEGGLRWALQGKRDGSQHNQELSRQSRTPDVERGYADSASSHRRTASETSFADSLPAYNAGDRSPPYTENQTVPLCEEKQPPPGWRQQLMISTSGLGVAMSEESLRSLRYCLGWLRWANQRLGGAIQSLRDLLQRWDEGATQEHPQPMSVAALTQSHDENRQAALSARIAALKADVLQTLTQVVGVVSNYAGGALPENARNLVHRHLTSLPQRFSIASAMSTNNAGGNEDEAAGSANRVMVLAQEGLDMMTQVTGVVNDTLVSAESWCEKLGRRRREDPQEERQMTGAGEKDFERDRSVTLEREHDTDVKMEM